MSFVVIQNFNHGLDTRRSNLTSTIGTLQTLQNAHVNQGGEIEKRKAFVKISFTPTLASGVTVIYDVIPLANSIALIGSQANADSANWPPAGYVYQYLHRKAVPTTLPGGTYPNSPNYCAQCANIISDIPISTVIHSTTFANKTLVLARMTDGTYCLFYDGNAVDDIDQFIQVLPDMNTNLKLFCMMARAFLGDAALGRSAINGYVADVRGALDGINITGQVGRDYSILLETSGFATLPVATLVSNSTPSIPGKVATGYFTIQDGIKSAGVNKITSVKVGVTELLSGGGPTAIDYQDSAELTAAAVVASINGSGVGYNAKNLGPSVLIYANATGTAANNKDITVTTSGNVMIGDSKIAFAGSGFTLNSIKVGETNLLTGPTTYPVAPGQTITSFVGLVSADINSGSGTHGYVSMNRNGILKISKVTTVSAIDGATEDISVDLTVTPGETGGVAQGGDMQVQTDQNPITIRYDVRRSGSSSKFFHYDISGIGSTINPVKAIITGGVAPFNFQWRVADQSNTAISFEYPTNDMTHIRDSSTGGSVVLVGINNVQVSNKVANIYLEVTDFEGRKAVSSVIPVKFTARLIA
jgi:hypothetical protein